jgi:Flp pilus assembly protein TadG
MRRAARGLRHSEHGAALIEFAILAPVFLLMVMGMIAYAIYFGAAHSVQQLAADAVRVTISGLSAAERQQLASGYVARNAGAYLLLDPQRLTVEVADRPQDPDQVLVSLSYDASTLPIWNLYPPLPLPSTTIVHRATIRIGGR